MQINRQCFCCEKKIEPCGPDGEDRFTNPPSDATYWQTLGNYGSTVFDGGEFTGEKLEMYICDECLKAKSHLVYQFRSVTKTEIKDIKLFGEKPKKSQPICKNCGRLNHSVNFKGELQLTFICGECGEINFDEIGQRSPQNDN